jgi:hypothetical protein
MAPVSAVADALQQWGLELELTVTRKLFAGGLLNNYKKLDPLTVGYVPRELLVGTTGGEWTAFFNCDAGGGGPINAVSYLCRRMSWNGVHIVSVPWSDPRKADVKQFGARQFQMFGPIPTHFLNYIRGVSLVQDGSSWHFNVSGTPQDFEILEAYNSRKVLERFTEEMLVSYCRALGIDPFIADFYSGPSILITSHGHGSEKATSFSLKEARRRLGISGR